MRESLREILLPFSALYGSGVSIRNFGYDNGVFKVRKLPVPVISVGNISVGGSGKTPFTMFLVGKFLALGRKPAVLSRGYKRLTDELMISCPGCGDEADIQMIGDEPALISMNFPHVPVAVCSDRHRAGLAVISRFGADVFVLDDGLQNRELHRDFDFVLLKHTLFDLRDHYLPAGNLRDSKKRIRRADVVVLTSHESFSFSDSVSEKIRNYTDAPAAGVSYVASGLLDSAGTQHSADFLRGKKVVAFCGIANPDQFFKTARSLSGTEVVQKRFPDHHWYDEYDVDEIFGGEEDIVAITTAKDAVRIFQDEELSQLEEVKRIFAVSEEARVNFGGEYIDDVLSRVCGKAYA